MTAYGFATGGASERASTAALLVIVMRTKPPPPPSEPSKREPLEPPSRLNPPGPIKSDAVYGRSDGDTIADDAVPGFRGNASSLGAVYGRSDGDTIADDAVPGFRGNASSSGAVRPRVHGGEGIGDIDGDCEIFDGDFEPESLPEALVSMRRTWLVGRDPDVRGRDTAPPSKPGCWRCAAASMRTEAGTAGVLGRDVRDPPEKRWEKGGNGEKGGLCEKRWKLFVAAGGRAHTHP